MNATLLRYAAIARGQRQTALGQVFQKAADSDRCEHFAQISETMHWGTDSVENLRKIIADKRAAAGLYATCAAECKEDGDIAAANVFELLKKDELEASLKLEAVLNDLAVQTQAPLAVQTH